MPGAACCDDMKPHATFDAQASGQATLAQLTCCRRRLLQGAPCFRMYSSAQAIVWDVDLVDAVAC